VLICVLLHRPHRCRAASSVLCGSISPSWIRAESLHWRWPCGATRRWRRFCPLRWLRSGSESGNSQILCILDMWRQNHLTVNVKIKCKDVCIRWSEMHAENSRYCRGEFWVYWCSDGGFDGFGVCWFGKWMLETSGCSFRQNYASMFEMETSLSVNLSIGSEHRNTVACG